MDHITGWNDKKNLQNIIDAGRDFDKWLIGIEDLIIILPSDDTNTHEPHQEN